MKDKRDMDRARAELQRVDAAWAGAAAAAVSFNDENGNRVTLRGKAVTIWRMENDAWKCVVDIWNDDPAPK